MVQIISKNSNVGLNLPTNIEEISVDYLKACMEPYDISENYCIIAMAMHMKLAELCMTLGNNNKEPKIGVVSLVAKQNIPERDNDYHVGDVAIISNNDLQRATPINIESNINYNFVVNYISSDKDLIKEILTGNPVDANGVDIRNAMIYMLQFRIVPLCDIKGYVPVKLPSDETFIFKVEK